ncbi:MAG TPA: SDR family oxidoreductase [Dermatophilaceae bacterium]|nr:SDR family oxidoreductase [Dermatophilaceae bacterium]
MRVVVTGGAGFVGSHLCDALHARGDHVVCVDDFSSGRFANIEQLRQSPKFELVEQDVRTTIRVTGAVDAVVNMASLASPPAYLARPIFTLQTGSTGTQKALDLAMGHDARFVQASTSEVYGDPLVHPQSEDYWGNVNPVGPRSVYDEAKRYAEALIAAHGRAAGLNGGIIRIFNTYGPRLGLDDGRVVTQFITQALEGAPLTVYGDGTQTRSLCYVSDLVRGFLAMIDGSIAGPVNLGNPHELTVREIAELVIDLVGSDSTIEFHDIPEDDPKRRKPDISMAQAELGWSPQVDVVDGLSRTIEWIRSEGLREDLRTAV